MSLKRTDVRSVSELEGLLKSVTSGLVTFDGCDGAGLSGKGDGQFC
jgi:hypothetical protein